MDLVFKARYGEHEIVATAKRPVTTRFSIAVDGNVVAESSRPVSTDFLCGIKTWFGMKPVWEIGGTLEIDGLQQDTTRHSRDSTSRYWWMTGLLARRRRIQDSEPSNNALQRTDAAEL